MISFIDGPASGVTLHLLRSPIVLRVVSDGNGNWDALDQLDDTALPNESIFIYMLVGKPTSMFVDYRGVDRRKSGLVINAKYRYFMRQPFDHEMRNNFAWNKWCNANKDRLIQEYEQQGTTDN